VSQTCRLAKGKERIKDRYLCGELSIVHIAIDLVAWLQ
jgi:hypothetical protein